ncbi:MAG TPA: type II secretion system protein N [Candidatus Binataceae bacterium]|nr:type II secretion system protein N [Candidatus Binataceae bacterium]HTY54533.1 type II secretion system protein N [Candidatus Binataceae bacterium]
MQIRLSGRYVTALNFILIGAIAYFGALSADDLIARSLEAGPRFDPPIQSAQPVIAPALPRASYSMIVERDVFNSIKEVAAPMAPAVVHLHVKLLGTSELTLAKPFAVIEDTSDHQQALYRLGDEIPDTGTLVAVERKRVLVSRDGNVTVLSISEGLASASAQSASAAKDQVADALESDTPLVQRTTPSPWKKLSPDQPIDWKELRRQHPHRSRSQLMAGSWGGGRLETRLQPVSGTSD